MCVCGGAGVVEGGSDLGDRLPVDQDGVRIFVAGVEHGHRALDPHDAVATLRQWWMENITFQGSHLTLWFFMMLLATLSNKAHLLVHVVTETNLRPAASCEIFL